MPGQRHSQPTPTSFDQGCIRVSNAVRQKRGCGQGRGREDSCRGCGWGGWVVDWVGGGDPSNCFQVSVRISPATAAMPGVNKAQTGTALAITDLITHSK